MPRKSYYQDQLDDIEPCAGEIVKGYEAITSAPKLPIISKTRWLTLIDGLMINGRRFTGNSHTYAFGCAEVIVFTKCQNRVSGVDVPDGTISAIFDTGISFSKLLLIIPQGLRSESTRVRYCTESLRRCDVPECSWCCIRRKVSELRCTLRYQGQCQLSGKVRTFTYTTASFTD